MPELVHVLKERHPDMLQFDIRSAFLPLLSTGLIVWTVRETLRKTKNARGRYVSYLLDLVDRIVYYLPRLGSNYYR